MSEQVAARPYHKNPRKISAQQVVQLREGLAELGDLGGIVHDLNSGEIISGNQRSFHAFDLAQCEIEITHRLEEPDTQGTVAHGFVVWQGGRYAYRQVRWTAEQCEKANIIANKAGGTWDIESLLSGFEREGLLAWGFSDFDLERLVLEIDAEIFPAEEEWESAFDGLPAEDRAPFQQMTFTLHDTQVEQVKTAIAAALAMGDFDSENENSNGNALARICEVFLTDHGQR